MLPLSLPTGALRVLALGAHCDDVEIGAGGTLGRLAQSRPDAYFLGVVLTSTPERAQESNGCLRAMLDPATASVRIHDLPDARLPAHFDEVKDILAELAREPWDLVLTHHRFDAHQDHRMLGELVATAFRDHLVWQFEIPKWDGDLGTSRPTLYVPLTQDDVDRKWCLLEEHYVSQRGHDWWDHSTFASLARLRGIECRSPYAEAFRVEKSVVSLTDRGPR